MAQINAETLAKQDFIKKHYKKLSDKEMADMYGCSRSAIKSQRMRMGLLKSRDGYGVENPFIADSLPASSIPVEDLIEERKKKFSHKKAHEEAKKLINVKINIDGPIGIVHFGDPHIDDDGTDIGMIEEHLNIVKNTPGLFGANVGDMQNNWVGRLARLYGDQSTSHTEAWKLTEWMIRYINWLYLIKGNHDLWTGTGDPLDFMREGQTGVMDAWGVRLNLQFPNGKEVRVNARHDFAGHSMWNTAHGVSKAVQMGWRDHILTCGHKHTSGYQVLKDPSTGLVSHAIRCASYKVYDRYATEMGLPNQNIFPAAVTIIDPSCDDDDPRLITTLFDVKRGAEFLTYLRNEQTR